MRTLLKEMLTGILAMLSRSIIRKHKPMIVMITGSVGKTSTKDAVAAALSEKFYLRKSDKSFNSDIGVPLTIIGASNPWSSPLAWIRIFKKALAILWLPTHYPKLLVLEVGADHPGDLAKILKITKPDAVVVTLLPSVPVHVEAYANPTAVRDEEFSPALALAPKAPLIISADDAYAIERADKIDKQVCTYGVSEEANVRIEEIEIWTESVTTDAAELSPKFEQAIERIVGMKATLIFKDVRYPLKVRGALGRSQLFSPAAAVATACALGMTPAEALEGLASYVPPPGRGRILKGKKNTLLIDDTYNSSPAAVEEILKSLERIPENIGAKEKDHKPNRKVVVLGDMLELGRYSIAEHAHVGHLAKEIADVLVTVGPRAKGISDTAKEDGMPESAVKHFETSLEAAVHVEALLEEGDVVLVKGSQSIRMERIVRPLLADFADTKKLARQDDEWLRR